MPDIVLIADDLTGAADSAAPFAAAGIPTRLILDRSERTDPGVTALSTDSRDLNPAGAREAVWNACRWIQEAGLSDAMLFKKIDSTLRGHIEDELTIVIERFGIDRLVLSPAFPDQGRTTIGGRHYVHGIPLNQTKFVGTGRSDVLVERFSGLDDLAVWHYPLEMIRRNESLIPQLTRPGIHISDVETGEDLRRFVDQSMKAEIRHFCGAGGIGRALASVLEASHRVERGLTPPSGPVLIVAGSPNQATLDQVRVAHDAGTAVIPLSGMHDHSEREVASLMRSGTNVIVTSGGCPHRIDDPRLIRATLATIVDRVVRDFRPEMLVLTGGDIAAAVCRTLGARALVLTGEVEPGIPCGVLEGGSTPGLPVVTKAGGFGDQGTFLRLLDSANR